MVNEMMNVSSLGKSLVRGEEKCRLRAYQPGDNTWTIGWGHTGSDVGSNTVWTREKADSTFDTDCLERDKQLNHYLAGIKLTQNEYDALFDFVYNEGIGNFIKSDLYKYLQTGDFVEASGEFPKFSFSKGRYMEDLYQRRLKEQALFRTPQGG